VGKVGRLDHAAPPRVSLVPGAGIQTVGEGLQAPVLTAMQLPPARAPPGAAIPDVWTELGCGAAALPVQSAFALCTTPMPQGRLMYTKATSMPNLYIRNIMPISSGITS
jgi:hypothetical protein